MVGSVWAVGALEGSFPSVDAYVCDHIELLEEGLATEWAGVPHP